MKHSGEKRLKTLTNRALVSCGGTSDGLIHIQLQSLKKRRYVWGAAKYLFKEKNDNFFPNLVKT